MSLVLKRLTLADMGRAAQVLRRSFDDRLPSLAGLHIPEEDRTFFRERVFPACEVWGACDPDLVGIIAFRAGWVDQLYVLPERQGRGVGSALLRRAMDAEPSLSLWTFERNAQARRFYEARGFVAVDRTDGSGNEEREADVLYRWDGPAVGGDRTASTLRRGLEGATRDPTTGGA